MKLLLLHPDLRSGYALARHLHRHSRHNVVAVVQTHQDVPPSPLTRSESTPSQIAIPSDNKLTNPAL